MNTRQEMVLWILLVSLFVFNVFHMKTTLDIREVQQASVHTQVSTGKVEMEMAKTLMRIDSNTRKGN